MMHEKFRRTQIFGSMTAAFTLLIVAGTASAQGAPGSCTRTIEARVVALDQPFMWNRLGASNPGGMIFALRRDVVRSDGQPESDGNKLKAGHVRLRTDKRARPLVLRANVGDCLVIEFQNLLKDSPPENATGSAKTRYAGIHAMGLELVGGVKDDASWVGKNASSLAKPDETKNYKLYAREEGTFLLYSPADPTTGQAAAGLFGAINVQPEGAEWYRSQVTRNDLHEAAYRVESKTVVNGRPKYTLPDSPSMK